MTSSPLLSVRGLRKVFPTGRFSRAPGKCAVDEVSFDVQAGEVVALVGESGSGKTTVARMIARLIDPTAGQILWRAQDVLAREAGGPSLRYRSEVQMIFQDPFGALNPVHTVGYHLERPLRRHRKAHGAQVLGAVHALLEAVGLLPAGEVARKYPHQLSGGQRQRVGIARALAVQPALLLADEPTSMLDVSIRVDILRLLRELKLTRDLGMLYITHDLGSARALADRILVMLDGRIVESGPAETVLDRPAHPYTRRLLDAVPSPDASFLRSSVPAQPEDPDRS